MQAVQIQDEQRYVATVADLCSSADGVLILCREDLSEATDLVKLIKSRHKEIEDERTRLVKPFNDGVKQINARFKAILSPLELAESDLKAKMLTFQKEEVAKADASRREQERKAAEEARLAAVRTAEGMPPVAAPVVVPLAVPQMTTYGQTGAVSTVKKVWAWDLVDIAMLAAHRPDLVMVDSAKVNAEIRGKGGDIPGLRVYEKETIAIR